MPKKLPLIAFLCLFIAVALACSLPGQAAPTPTPKLSVRTPTGAYTRTIPVQPSDTPAPAATVGQPPVLPPGQPTQPISALMPSLTANVLLTLIPIFPQTNATPTPQPVGYCGYGPDQRLVVGKDGKVCTKKDPLILREQPNRNSKQVAQLWTGTIVDILGGPRCDGDWSYWSVRTSDQQVGWAAEGGDNVDPYFLCPVN
jgi:hypothetical protein